MGGLEEWLSPASAGTETGLSIAQARSCFYGSSRNPVTTPISLLFSNLPEIIWNHVRIIVTRKPFTFRIL